MHKLHGLAQTNAVGTAYICTVCIAWHSSIKCGRTAHMHTYTPCMEWLDQMRENSTYMYMHTSHRMALLIVGEQPIYIYYPNTRLNLMWENSTPIHVHIALQGLIEQTHIYMHILLSMAQLNAEEQCIDIQCTLCGTAQSNVRKNIYAYMLTLHSMDQSNDGEQHVYIHTQCMELH